MQARELNGEIHTELENRKNCCCAAVVVVVV